MHAIDRFSALVDRPAERVDLAAASLAFAAIAEPSADIDAWLQVLDHLAVGVADFDDLRHRLFVQEGFTGDQRSYYAPENSLLHRVLERRLGIPITLSVVALSVGARAGVPVEGIGAPGHFLLRDPLTRRLCDPFSAGALVEGSRLPVAVDARQREAALPVVDAHQILQRMLGNLAHAYRRRQRTADVEWVLRCQRALPGARVHAAVQLGEVIAAQGRYREAALEVEATVAVVDEADGERLRRTARALRAHLN